MNDLLVIDEREAQSSPVSSVFGWGGLVSVASMIPDAFAFRVTEHETKLSAFTREEGAVLIDAVNLLFPHAGLGPRFMSMLWQISTHEHQEARICRASLNNSLLMYPVVSRGSWQGVSEATRISKLTAVQESSGFWQLGT